MTGMMISNHGSGKLGRIQPTESRQNCCQFRIQSPDPFSSLGQGVAQAFRDEEKGRHALNRDSFSLMEDAQSPGLTDGGPGAEPQAEETGKASGFTHSWKVLDALCSRTDWSSQGLPKS